MKTKIIFLILFFLFSINKKETGFSIGTNEIFADTKFIVFKTKECIPKVPETIGSWMSQEACEFYHTGVKPIQKCFDDFRLDKAKGVACALDITNKIKSTAPDCSAMDSEQFKSICESAKESLQKVSDCFEYKGNSKEARECAKVAIKDFHGKVQENAKSLFANTKDTINRNPDFASWAASGEKDPISREILNPNQKVSSSASAIKEIQAKIAAYSGRAFDSEINQAIKNDAAEQIKMAAEQAERERQERIARAERERQERIDQLRRKAEQDRERYEAAKRSGPNSSACLDWKRMNQAGRQGSQMAGMMGYDTRAFDTALSYSEAGAAVCQFVDKPTLESFFGMAEASQQAYQAAQSNSAASSMAIESSFNMPKNEPQVTSCGRSMNPGCNEGLCSNYKAMQELKSRSFRNNGAGDVNQTGMTEQQMDGQLRSIASQCGW